MSEEKSKTDEPRQSSTHFNKFLKSFISGGLAGSAAKSIIAPLDRVKILFQVQEKFEK